ncbi:nuclear factor 7, brain-like [Colossoma macropomum]|uniref:nuclear factor 7, brain-like n=1 Tax=Colossoma macropomum TaxID=42526 RepID=UPI001864583A|nr:nuclear factor 7, brain-like [Colossoma macropomum]
MASKRAFSEEDFTCPVCCDIFKEPVLLSCGHSVCRRCVRRYWRSKRTRECPLCREPCSRDPPVNLALRNLSQTFQEVQEDPETLCDIHGERLKLYCVDEAQPVCVVCRDSLLHQHHTFRPVEEIAAELKKTLESELKIVTAKSKNFQDAQLNYHQNIDHIKNQVQHIEKQIKEEFTKLHQFLGKEMIPMLKTLREEAKEKIQRQKERIEKINQEEETLSKTATDIEKELQSEDSKFIKNFEKTLGK